jgi:hypothetical protein
VCASASRREIGIGVAACVAVGAGVGSGVAVGGTTCGVAQPVRTMASASAARERTRKWLFMMVTGNDR